MARAAPLTREVPESSDILSAEAKSAWVVILLSCPLRRMDVPNQAYA
jgi:hypothetical protein